VRTQPASGDHPPGHPGVPGSGSESLRQYFGTKKGKPVIPSLAPGAGPTRTYETLDELVKDVENARVWGGLHYRTTMTQSAKHFPRIAKDVGKPPEEIAEGILFLVSPEGRFAAGIELVLDGGYSA